MMETEAMTRSHSLLLLQGAQNFYEQGLLLDVTLECEGEYFPAHSLVLASFSSRLKTLLVSDDSFSQQISLDGLQISADNLRSLVNFMYTGVLSEVKDPASLAVCARKLRMQDAVDQLQLTEEVPDDASKVSTQLNEFQEDVLQAVKKEIEQQIQQVDCESIGETNAVPCGQREPETPTKDAEQDLSKKTRSPQKKTAIKTEPEAEQVPETSERILQPESEPPKRKRGRPRKNVSEVKDKVVKVEPSKKTRKPLALVTVDKQSRPSLDTTEQNNSDLVDDITARLEIVLEDAPTGDDSVSEQRTTRKAARAANKVKSETGRVEKRQAGKKRKDSYMPKSRTIAGLVHCQACDCEYRTKTQKAFYNHWILKHTDSYTHCCQHCSKTFKLRKYLVSHLTTHSDDRPFCCEECGAGFKQAKHLVRHVKSHNDKEFGCSHCDHKARSKNSLQRHVLRVHQKTTPCKCPLEGCEYSGLNNDALKRHHYRKHSGIIRMDILCDICGKNFRTRQSLKMHSLLHFGDQIKCPQCTYSSVNKSVLNSHMMRRHGVTLSGSEAQFRKKCDICGTGCFTMAEYRMHMLRHEGHKPHKCPICDFATIDKGSLKKHMRSHTGETPFKCKQCGKSFSQQSGFARHRRIHLGIKPHKCATCGKAYADKKSLIAHKYTHLDVKPFNCKSCSYECTKKDILQKHMLSVHSVMPDTPARKRVTQHVHEHERVNFYVEQVVEVETEQPVEEVVVEESVQAAEQQSLVVETEEASAAKNSFPLVLLLQAEQEMAGE